MKNYMRVLFSSVLLILMSCMAVGPQDYRTNVNDIANNEVSRLYIYRPTSWYGIGGSPTIYLDDQTLGKLSNNGYTILSFKPGMHSMQAKWNSFTRPVRTKDKSFLFNYEAGEIYYLSYREHGDSIPTSRFEFELVDKVTAERYLSKSRKLKW